MGFQLVIASGENEGQRFSFDAPHARIGRTDDNDVVLDEPGVSRTHARVFWREGRYFAEDLGSSNGTKINGRLIRTAAELSDGDTVAVGKVVMAFRLTTSRPPPPVPNPAPLSTPPHVSLDGLSNPPAELSSGRRRQLFGEEEVSDTTNPERPKKKAQPGSRADEVTAVDPDAAPARVRVGQAPTAAPQPEELDERLANSALARLAGKPKRPTVRFKFSEGGLPTGLERARQLWAGVDAGKKLAGAGLLSLLALAGLVLYLASGNSEPEPPARPEPAHLSRQPLEDSFGVGSGVTWKHPDAKTFDFGYATKGRAIAVLHYQAKDASPGEVSLVLNGSALGQVPADSPNADERDIQQLLPVTRLKREPERNQLIFQHTASSDDWRVWNLWVEIVPLPALADPALVEAAKAALADGKLLWDKRAAAPENLFKAWKSTRTAWLYLEALPTHPDPYPAAAAQLAQLDQQLNDQCGKLMLQAQQSLELKDRVKARQALEAVASYFPTAEHRCHNLALEKLEKEF